MSIRKSIIGLVAIAALVVPTAAMANGVDRAQCDTTTTETTATFTVLQPKDTITQWGNVWQHDYTVTFTGKNTFSGFGAVTDNGGTLTWTERIDGTFNPDGTVSFLTDPVGGGAWFKVTNAPMDNTPVSVASDWAYNIIEFKISAPVVTPGTASGEYKNHGDYVSSNGGGADAAHKNCGMPIQSKGHSK